MSKYTDVKEYIENKWPNISKPIKEISKSDEGAILVNSDEQMYDFDEICDSLYKKINNKSADGLIILNSSIELVEFKSGFKDKNLIETIGDSDYCNHTSKTCRYKENGYKKERETIKDQMVFSITRKAVESYIILSKEIVEKSNNNINEYKLDFYVVTDYCPVDAQESILGELANNNDLSDTNFYKKLNNYLKLLKKNIGYKKEYFYDEIEILNVSDYIDHINKCYKNKI